MLKDVWVCRKCGLVYGKSPKECLCGNKEFNWHDLSDLFLPVVEEALRGQ